MGTDMGNELPDGNLLPDVLLRTICKVNLQKHFPGKESFLVWKLSSLVCQKELRPTNHFPAPQTGAFRYPSLQSHRQMAGRR